MGANINIEVWSVCYVCDGKGWIRLGHAAVSTCWACKNGKQLDLQTQTWTSFERCLMDKDPFQNGAHSTFPAFYIENQIKRWEVIQEDAAFAQLRNEYAPSAY